MADPIKNARQTADAKKLLLDQARVLSLKVDPAWNVDDLAFHVLEAEEAKTAADAAEFAAAPKVWVFLLRDGWPVADERHNAGETIEVTQEIADKWYEAGVARPGKAPVT